MLYFLFEAIIQFISRILEILGYTEIIKCPTHLGFVVDALDQLKHVLYTCFHNGATHITLYVHKSDLKQIHKKLKYEKYNISGSNPKSPYTITLQYPIDPVPKTIIHLHSQFKIDELKHACRKIRM